MSTDTNREPNPHTSLVKTNSTGLIPAGIEVDESTRQLFLDELYASKQEEAFVNGYYNNGNGNLTTFVVLPGATLPEEPKAENSPTADHGNQVTIELGNLEDQLRRISGEHDAKYTSVANDVYRLLSSFRTVGKKVDNWADLQELEALIDALGSDFDKDGESATFVRPKLTLQKVKDSMSKAKAYEEDKPEIEEHDDNVLTEISFTVSIDGSRNDVAIALSALTQETSNVVSGSMPKTLLELCEHRYSMSVIAREAAKEGIAAPASGIARGEISLLSPMKNPNAGAGPEKLWQALTRLQSGLKSIPVPDSDGHHSFAKYTSLADDVRDIKHMLPHNPPDFAKWENKEELQTLLAEIEVDVEIDAKNNASIFNGVRFGLTAVAAGIEAAEAYDPGFEADNGSLAITVMGPKLAVKECIAKVAAVIDKVEAQQMERTAKAFGFEKFAGAECYHHPDERLSVVLVVPYADSVKQSFVDLEKRAPGRTPDFGSGGRYSHILEKMREAGYGELINQYAPMLSKLVDGTGELTPEMLASITGSSPFRRNP